MLGSEFKQEYIRTSGAQINVLHGGTGKPLLLLHGYPQTHAMWHRIASRLALQFHVVCMDLRGYGDSSKPQSPSDHSAYSKRAMSQDAVEVMESLGYKKFLVAGHDRGARVTHRITLDYPDRVLKACLLDIVPTLYMFKTADQNFATRYYHWFFLIQPGGLPEHLIASDPKYYLMEKLKRWSAPGAVFEPSVVAEYVRCFSQSATIHATCEDYRAAATIDLEHDKKDENRRVKCPLLVLWGSKGFVGETYDVLGVWSNYADQVSGKAIDCGHFLPEEAPTEVSESFFQFFSSVDCF